jgi:hypothetical protein
VQDIILDHPSHWSVGTPVCIKLVTDTELSKMLLLLLLLLLLPLLLLLLLLLLFLLLLL